MTGLEALNIIVDKCAIKEYNENGDLISWIGTTDKEYIVIEKELKALEIIKNKKVDTYALNVSNCLESYNNYAKWENSKLTQEEYSLLKEVL